MRFDDDGDEDDDYDNNNDNNNNNNNNPHYTLPNDFFFSDIPIDTPYAFLASPLLHVQLITLSFGYINNIYKIKVSDMGGNKNMYKSNAIPAQACYRLRGF